LLAKLAKTNDQLQSFLDWNSKCEGGPIENLLMLPLQRFPRYATLLQAIRANTPTTEKQYSEIYTVHETFVLICQKVMNGVSDAQELRKVLYVQKLLEKDRRYVDLATPTRLLIHKGVIKKRYVKSSRHLAGAKFYHFFVFNDIFMYAAAPLGAKSKDTDGHRLKLKHCLALADTSVTPVAGKPEFDVKNRSKGKSFTVICSGFTERDEWVSILQRAIEGTKFPPRRLDVEYQFDKKAKPRLLMQSASSSSLTKE